VIEAYDASPLFNPLRQREPRSLALAAFCIPIAKEEPPAYLILLLIAAATTPGSSEEHNAHRLDMAKRKDKKENN
jgi:hypothetical protein